MNKETEFLIYCIEIYRHNKGLSGTQIAELFDKFHLCEFIIDQYPLLHITGNQNIIQDIDEYLAEQQTAAPQTGADGQSFPSEGSPAARN